MLEGRLRNAGSKISCQAQLLSLKLSDIKKVFLVEMLRKNYLK